MNHLIVYFHFTVIFVVIKILSPHFKFDHKKSFLIQTCKVNHDLAHFGVVLAIRNASHFKHSARCSARYGVMIFVRLINNLDDASLNNHFGTFIAGEQCRIDSAAF